MEQLTHLSDDRGTEHLYYTLTRNHTTYYQRHYYDHENKPVVENRPVILATPESVQDKALNRETSLNRVQDICQHPYYKILWKSDYLNYPLYTVGRNLKEILEQLDNYGLLMNKEYSHDALIYLINNSRLEKREEYDKTK